MKNDKYRRARGGQAYELALSCASCDAEILHYQKDGIGTLQRCYLNRIIAPKQLAEMQFHAHIQTPRDMPNLICTTCNKVIGAGMKYTDGRLAYRLVKGSFKKKKL